jgi:hypothetical protein
MNLTAKSLKCTLVLDAGEIGALPEPTTSRVVLRIDVAGRTVTADVAAKAVRKARAAVSQHGGDDVVVLIQGKLGAHDAIDEAGLVVQPRTPAVAAAPLARVG